jgi:hypothetical protein
MIYNDKYGKIISNLGWVDKGSLWFHDLELKKSYSEKISSADYLSLNQINKDYFSILHLLGDNHFMISIHHFDNPGKILSSYDFNNYKITIKDEEALIKYVPRYYIVGLKQNGSYDNHLAILSSNSIIIDFEIFDWYRNGAYDFGYQNLLTVNEFNDLLLFTIQRDGSLYLYDKNKEKLIKRISLPGNLGNPRLRFLSSNDYILIDNYDTIVKLKVNNWKVKKSKLIQAPDNNMAQQFIGEFNLTPDEKACIIPRPFSGDVVILDTKKLKIRQTINIGKQPIEAILSNDGQIISRDWQSGEFLDGVI